jgi:hypothetical protein
MSRLLVSSHSPGRPGSAGRNSRIADSPSGHRPRSVAHTGPVERLRDPTCTTLLRIEGQLARGRAEAAVPLPPNPLAVSVIDVPNSRRSGRPSGVKSAGTASCSKPADVRPPVGDISKSGELACDRTFPRGGHARYRAGSSSVPTGGEWRGFQHDFASLVNEMLAVGVQACGRICARNRGLPSVIRELPTRRVF